MNIPNQRDPCCLLLFPHSFNNLARSSLLHPQLTNRWSKTSGEEESDVLLSVWPLCDRGIQNHYSRLLEPIHTATSYGRPRASWPKLTDSPCSQIELNVLHTHTHGGRPVATSRQALPRSPVSRRCSFMPEHETLEQGHAHAAVD